MTEAQPFNPVLVAPDGRPPRSPGVPKACPGCGAGPELRDVMGGFGGVAHDVCQKCGHEFSVAESQRR